MKKNQKQQTEGGAKVGRKTWLYGLLSASVILFAAVIVFIVLAVNGAFAHNTPNVDNGENPPVSDNNPPPVSDNNPPADDENNSDVNTGTTNSFVNPLDFMTVLTEQEFHHNVTLNCYYKHIGIDVSAVVGSEVYAICSGTVEAIYSDDILQGTQIILDNGNGMRVVYNYVDPVDNLSVGSTVTQGQVIAKIANANGSEYKSGAHLHLEMYLEGELVDPAQYLTLSEK